MKICFCSSIYNMEKYQYLQDNSRVSLSLADHNLSLSIIRGLDQNMDAPTTLINSVPLPSYPNYPDVFFKTTKWTHVVGADDVDNGYINLPFLKQITKCITTFINLFKFAQRNIGQSLVVFTYDMNPYLCIPVIFAKCFYKNIKTCLVVPDIPTVMVEVILAGKKSTLHILYSKLKEWLGKKFDVYVLLTDQMREKLELGNKPYVVIEGIYNQSNTDEKLNEVAEQGKRIVFYSGALRSAYGLKTLVEAFCGLEDTSYELWICGNGELAEYISEQTKITDKIKYFEYLDTEKLLELQKKATVLINPRQNTGEYTKYSFPSKTIEYLASGKPVIGYKLAGIPNEYDQYIQYVPNNSVEALRDKIVEICSLSDDERNSIGARSRRFILENKTLEIQCKKIVDMLKKQFR